MKFFKATVWDGFDDEEEEKTVLIVTKSFERAVEILQGEAYLTIWTIQPTLWVYPDTPGKILAIREIYNRVIIDDKER